jgi:hypothetical protein
MLFVVNKAGNVVFSHTGFQPGMDFILAQQFDIKNYTPLPGVARPSAGAARPLNSPVASRPPPAPLNAPVQVSPPDRVTFYVLPRTTELVWNATPGAHTYGVEVDCLYCCSRTQWCTDVGRPYLVKRDLTRTEYTFHFVGAQPPGGRYPFWGRWRVWAIEANGQEGPKSPWRGFAYAK